MWSDVLTTQEVDDYFKRVRPTLENHVQGNRIVREIEKRGGVNRQTEARIVKPLLFEARFAVDLVVSDIDWEYEHKTGVDDSSVDFRIEKAGVRFLIELVSIQASATAKANMVECGGGIYSQTFGGVESDSKMSIAQEMILVQQKLLEKVVGNRGPTKFPSPVPEVVHGIVADLRGFLEEGGDTEDYRQIVYGLAGLPEEQKQYGVSYSQGDKNVPVRGLFDPKCPAKGAQQLQDRVHFVGLVAERAYGDSPLVGKIESFENPSLSVSQEVSSALQGIVRASKGYMGSGK